MFFFINFAFVFVKLEKYFNFGKIFHKNMAKTAIEFLKRKCDKAGVDFKQIASGIVDERTLHNWQKKNPKSIENFMALNKAVNEAIKQA